MGTGIGDPRARRQGSPESTDGTTCSILGRSSVYPVMSQPVPAITTVTPVTSEHPPPTVWTAAELCECYASKVYRFAAMVSRGNGEAEDLAQDSLERAIRGFPSFDPARGSVEAWLWRIVVNAARDADRIRVRRWHLIERLQLGREPRDEIAPDIADSIGDEALLAAVRRLGRRDRALIALRFGAGLDFAGVAAALGMTPAAAGVATRRVLARLRHDLEQARERSPQS